MSMTSLTSLRAAKEHQHIDRAASWAGKIPYGIYFVITNLWCCSAEFSDSEFLTLSTKWRAQTGLLVGWYNVSSILTLKDKIE